MPETIIPNGDDRTLVARAVDRFLTLQNMWGNLSGVVLACHWHDEDPWVSAVSVARRLGVSDDTARRYLDDLAAAGRAYVTVRSRRKFYKAEDGLARRTTLMVREDVPAGRQ